MGLCVVLLSEAGPRKLARLNFVMLLPFWMFIKPQRNPSPLVSAGQTNWGSVGLFVNGINWAIFKNYGS